MVDVPPGDVGDTTAGGHSGHEDRPGASRRIHRNLGVLGGVALVVAVLGLFLPRCGSETDDRDITIYCKRGGGAEQGQQGERGEQGTVGPCGASAYEIWLRLGNEGTEADFIASLRGPQGQMGPTGAQGAPGSQGVPGVRGQ